MSFGVSLDKEVNHRDDTISLRQINVCVYDKCIFFEGTRGPKDQNRGKTWLGRHGAFHFDSLVSEPLLIFLLDHIVSVPGGQCSFLLSTFLWHARNGCWELHFFSSWVERIVA